MLPAFMGLGSPKNQIIFVILSYMGLDKDPWEDGKWFFGLRKVGQRPLRKQPSESCRGQHSYNSSVVVPIIYFYLLFQGVNYSIIFSFACQASASLFPGFITITH